MNKFVRRAAMAALLASAASAATVIAFEPLYAAQAPRGKAAPAKGDPTTQVRTQVGNPVNDSLKLLDANDFAGALAKVQQADMVPMKTPFEEYTVAKYLGNIYIKQMPQNLPAATVAYNRQVASGACPDAEKPQMYAMALRLNYAAMDYAKVIQNVTELKKIGGPAVDETAHLVLIQSYYNTNDFKNAAQAAKDAAAAATAEGKKPSADVLGLLLNSQAKIMDEAGYRVTLDQLATVSTQADVWSQVMDFALSTKDLQDHHLLNIYRLAMLVGTMRDVDYSAMATIDLTNGLPAEAKAVLTKGNKTGDLMNQANQLGAKDQESLPALAAEADKAPTGEIFVKLGESYWTYGKFNEAVDAIQKGIAKGGIKDMPDAQTTLGIALFSAGKKADALAQFEKAAMANTPAGPVAHTWALFLQRPAA